MQSGQPIAGCQFSAENIRQMVQDFKAYKNVPIFNFEITQEGMISPESVEIFKKVLK